MRQKESTRECINIDIDCYDMLEEQLARVTDRRGVIVMGNMNARTGKQRECVITNESESVTELCQMCYPCNQIQQTM